MNQCFLIICRNFHADDGWPWSDFPLPSGDHPTAHRAIALPRTLFVGRHFIIQSKIPNDSRVLMYLTIFTDFF